MEMPLTEHTFIKIELRTFVVLIIGIITIVSSFWIGYGNIMQKLDRIQVSQGQHEVRIEALEKLAVK